MKLLPLEKRDELIYTGIAVYKKKKNETWLIGCQLEPPNI